MLIISCILIAEGNPPNLRDVFMMYCNMTHGTTLRDLCVRFNPQALRIDERKLVQFGLLHKLIRRVHKVMSSHISRISMCSTLIAWTVHSVGKLLMQFNWGHFSKIITIYKDISSVRFGVFMAVRMTLLFRVVMLCRLVRRYSRDIVSLKWYLPTSLCSVTTQKNITIRH
jgi:hypothetical protein